MVANREIIIVGGRMATLTFRKRNEFVKTENVSVKMFCGIVLHQLRVRSCKQFVGVSGYALPISRVSGQGHCYNVIHLFIQYY